MPAVGPDGELYVIWMDVDFGVGWQFFPWVAVDATGRITVMLLHSLDLKLVDVYVTESFDHGTTFNSPIKITNQSSNPSNASWTHHYQGIVSGGGYTYPLWTDYRNGNADVFVAPWNCPPMPPQNLAIANAGHSGENPHLTWDANKEQDLWGYYVYRKKGRSFLGTDFESVDDKQLHG